MVKGRISVIISHYNQLQYLQNAINSVLCQNYPDIELLIADDATQGFDENAVRDSIDIADTNVTKLVILSGKENLGTVACLNNASEKCSGEYLLMFAADDALQDLTVLSALKERLDADESAAAAFGRCMEYDEQLRVLISEYYYGAKKSKILGTLNAKEQNERLCFGCIISIGSTLFRRSVLKARPFNKAYQYIEDWPLFLYLTRKGEHLVFADLEVLRHRAGGVSRQGNNVLSQAARKCNIEFIHILEREVLPYLYRFSLATQNDIITRYEVAIDDTVQVIGRFKHRHRVWLYLRHPVLMTRRYVKRHSNKGSDA